MLLSSWKVLFCEILPKPPFSASHRVTDRVGFLEQHRRLLWKQQTRRPRWLLISNLLLRYSFWSPKFLCFQITT